MNLSLFYTYHALTTLSSITSPLCIFCNLYTCSPEEYIELLHQAGEVRRGGGEGLRWKARIRNPHHTITFLASELGSPPYLL
ncbi:MAG: hypothetical protein AYK19_21435 [Theionarchaea archaeon DG-70-1]|nr:MAG: hypothetical protein AYK19_21435 [Theionarchaea archaeon DG-70-1]